MDMHGSHFWMVYFPDWFLAVAMIFLGYGVLFLCRDGFEGLHYNVSYASVLGDTGLIGIVLIAAGILKRHGAVPADWLRSANFHYVCIVVASAVGGFLLAKVRKEQGWFGEYADQYHNAFIAPMLTYLLLTLVPVIWLYGSGGEIKATVFFLVLCFSLVIVDAKTKRLDQQSWLQARGIHLRSSRR